MVKHFILVFVLIMVSVTVSANPGIIEKNGKCTIKEAGAFDEAKLWVLDLKNDEAQIVFRVRGDKFFDRFVLMSSPKVTNLTDKPKHLAYSMAFFAKNGNLIACTTAQTDLKPGAKGMQTGSSMPEIPKSRLEKIVSYKVVVYISEGKKK